MDRILDAIVKAPMAAKAGTVAAIVVLLTALNYFVVSIPTFGNSISEIEQRAGVPVEILNHFKNIEIDNRKVDPAAIMNAAPAAAVAVGLALRRAGDK